MHLPNIRVRSPTITASGAAAVGLVLVFAVCGPPRNWQHGGGPPLGGGASVACVSAVCPDPDDPACDFYAQLTLGTYPLIATQVVLARDARGNAVQITTDRSPADGEPEVVVRQRWDEHDRPVTREVRMGGHPRTREHWTYYGPAGTAVRRSWYYELGTGEFLGRTQSWLDASGRPVTTWSDGDENPDWEERSVRRYVEDAQGRLVRIEIDANGDGAVDRRYRRSYHVAARPDAVTRVALFLADRPDGPWERIGTLWLDRFGNDVRFEQDRDGDGIPEHIRFDEYGPDGKGDQVSLWLHDAHGRPTTAISIQTRIPRTCVG